jgi:hypothetical protein
MEYTLESIGEQLNAHIVREEEMGKKVHSLYETVVVGNGKPPLKAEVARHSDWIHGVNRFIWLVIGALVGQFIVTSCSFTIMILIVLVNNGVIAP